MCRPSPDRWVADAKLGDQTALEKLMDAMTPLCISLSRRFSWQEDARQSGFEAVLHALAAFDPARGVRFATYAVPWMLGAMKKAGRSCSWRVQRDLRAVLRAEEQVRMREMRPATVQDIAAQTGLHPSDIAWLTEMSRRQLPGDDAIEAVADTAQDQWMDRLLLRDMLARLPEGERALLHLRYVKQVKQKEAADLLHTSQSGISRMEHQVLSRLRAMWQEEI